MEVCVQVPSETRKAVRSSGVWVAVSQATWILRMELGSFVRAVPTVKHLFSTQTFYKIKESVPRQQHCMFFLLVLMFLYVCL